MEICPCFHRQGRGWGGVPPQPPALYTTEAAFQGKVTLYMPCASFTRVIRCACLHFIESSLDKPFLNGPYESPVRLYILYLIMPPRIDI